jgi:hypothetical protein
VKFLQPYHTVLRNWKDLIAEVYRPEALYERYAHNLACTYPNRIALPASPQRASWPNMRLGLRMMKNLTVQVGLRSDYRRTFWRVAWPLLCAGRIEDLLRIGLVAHHLITFAREAVADGQNASFYSRRARLRQALP